MVNDCFRRPGNWENFAALPALSAFIAASGDRVVQINQLISLILSVWHGVCS
jgi:hypothetical protein